MARRTSAAHRWLTVIQSSKTPALELHLLRHPIRSVLNDQHSKKTVLIRTSPSSVPPVTMATLMEQGWKHRFAAMMTHLSSVLLRHDVPQRNLTTWLFLPSSAKKPHQKLLRQNQSPRKLLVGEPLESRVNAVSLRAASTDRRSLWLTPHEKSSSFLNCTIETRSVQSRTLPLNPIPLSPLSSFLSVLRVDASPRGTGIIPVPIFVYTLRISEHIPADTSNNACSEGSPPFPITNLH